MNILNTKFNTPYNTAPFSQIKDEDFLPAFKIAIQKAKAEIDAIVNTIETPTFENTIEALDYSGEELSRISSIFFNLNSAETNEDIQNIAQEVSPLLSEFSNDVTLNEALFKRVKVVYDSKVNLKLTTEQQTLLDKKYKGFSRNGANLPEDKKEQLRAIDKELSQLKLKFGEHILAETNAFEMHLTNENDLDGLPEGAKEAAKQLAESKGKDGWLITLDYPSYIPFMTYANNRELREQLAKAFGSKGFKNNTQDNQAIVLKITKLRFERAQLLGYKTHSHFVLEERMAETPEHVNRFLSDLLDKAKPAAKREFEDLQHFAKTLKDSSNALAETETLQKWDSAYYSEKLKQKLFSLDDEQLKPYFKLENVIDGAFTVAKKLFGLQFEDINTIDKYHEDVLTYKVTDTEGELVSILYADFFPRAGKRNGAWMTSFKSQMQKNGVNERPHVSIVCNFTKPTKTKPSLLTFNEVTTLFHEFGHALHGMLANTTYPSLSGTSVHWDFVELPSQILENWCYEEETLKLFATHYETGAVIPMDLIEKIKASASFHQGMQTLRQLSFGMLDMAWHAHESPDAITSVKAFENDSFKNTQLYPDVAENCMSTAFAHIFQGGYSSGYYSYKWAEVLDADAFEYFKTEGIFNKTVATKFKTFILSQGGTENPMTLYKKFRGKAPKPEALLKRAGLLN